MQTVPRGVPLTGVHTVLQSQRTMCGCHSGDVWPRNDSLGVMMLETAAEGGNVNAKLALAYRQWQGMGVEKDCDRAFQYPTPPPSSNCLHVLSLPFLLRSFLMIPDPSRLILPFCAACLPPSLPPFLPDPLWL